MFFSAIIFALNIIVEYNVIDQKTNNANFDPSSVTPSCVFRPVFFPVGVSSVFRPFFPTTFRRGFACFSYCHRGSCRCEPADAAVERRAGRTFGRPHERRPPHGRTRRPDHRGHHRKAATDRGDEAAEGGRHRGPRRARRAGDGNEDGRGLFF